MNAGNTSRQEPERNSHHFVSQMSLRRFAVKHTNPATGKDEPYTWVHSRLTDRSKLEPIRTTACVRHLNVPEHIGTEPDLSLEVEMGRAVESPAGEPMQALLKNLDHVPPNERLEIPSDARQPLGMYVALHAVRTPASAAGPIADSLRDLDRGIERIQGIERHEQIAWVREALVSEFPEHPNADEHAEEIVGRLTAGTFDAFPKARWLSGIMKRTNEGCKALSELDWQFLRAAHGYEFAISDNPAILVADEEDEGRSGITEKSRLVLYPLSPRFMLAAARLPGKQGRVINLTAEEQSIISRLTVFNAVFEVYAASDRWSEWAPYLNKSSVHDGMAADQVRRDRVAKEAGRLADRLLGILGQ